MRNPVSTPRRVTTAFRVVSPTCASSSRTKVSSGWLRQHFGRSVGWLAMALGFVGACVHRPAPPNAAAPQAATERAHDIARSLLGTWSKGGDPAMVRRLFRADAVYRDVPNGRAIRGLDRIAGFVGHPRKWAPDFRLAVHRIVGTRPWIVAQWVMTGHQRKRLRFLPPTGRAFKVEGLTLIKVEGDKITEAIDYYDVATFLKHLGVRFRPPANTVQPRK